MFSCNPLNTIKIYPVNSGCFAQELSRNAKGVVNVVESCLGKHTPEVARDQFTRMGYKDIQILPFLNEAQLYLKRLFG